MQEQSIDNHLNAALSHMEAALNESLLSFQENHNAKKELAPKWEHFLGEFFGMVKEKGKKSQVNLLSWISFPRIR